MDKNMINPDEICQRAMQVKMEVYRSKESFETVLKNYNDHVEALINVIGMMKKRILELEKVMKEEKVVENVGA